MSHDWRQHWQQLDQLLRQLASFWQPIPFHTPHPAWISEAPALHAWVSTLSDDDCLALQDQPGDVLSAAREHLPELDALHALARLPTHTPLDAHQLTALTDTPLRKAHQARHLSHALQPLQKPMIDWCCGKGHLARVLAQQSGLSVTGYERDSQLVEDGNALALRYAPSVRLVQRDVLVPWQDATLFDQHCVALHACGDLHRQLLRVASTQRAARISLSPCCYHLAHAGVHEPLSQFVQQQTVRCTLTAEQMRLAVQETVTAPARVRAARIKANQWRLGFDALQRTLRSDDRYLPVPSHPTILMHGSFAEFCAWAAQRKELLLPAQIDYDHWEQQGRQRWQQVCQHELVRHLFRRPLEIWLLLDYVLFLDEQGYRVTVAEFCSRTLTPRNVLIDARHTA
jgi:hypothetical protein